MARKPTMKSLSNKADRIWAEKVKARAKGRCEYCGSYEGVQSHHVVSRRVRRLRFDVRNGVALCPRDHLIFAHQHPLAFARWFSEYRPEDHAYLTDPDNVKPIQRSLSDMEEVLEDLAA